MKFTTAVVFALASALMISAASAQEDSPIDLPELRDDAVQVVEIPFPKTLPQGLVAKIDDQELTQADLLKELLRANMQTISRTLLMTKMVDLELDRNEVEIPAESIKAELDAMLPRLAPNKTLDEVLATGVYSLSYLKKIARMQRGMKELYWRAKNVPQENRNDEANQILMRLFANELQGRYQLAVRGKNPPPPAGAIAAINTIVGGKRVSYTIQTAEALEFLVGLMRPATLVSAQETLIDNALVQREMDKANVTVTDTEIEAFVREQIERYPPPISWDVILRTKGRTPDSERTRWRNVQAWKRSGNLEISADDLDVFRRENEEFFRNRSVKVSHILVKAYDPVTGLPLGEEARAIARKKIDRIYQLAEEGVDFGELAQRFSDDDQTKSTRGALTQPIKKWGGGYDVDFQRVAYSLEKGQLSKPVATQFGFHVIFCDEVNAPTRRQINWNDSRYAEWILDEYETFKMEAWIRDLKAKSKVEKVSREELIKLKSAEFPRDNGS